MWLLGTHVAQRLHKLDRERGKGTGKRHHGENPRGGHLDEEEMLALHNHMHMFAGFYQIKDGKFILRQTVG